MKRSEMEKILIYWFADNLGLEMFDNQGTALLDAIEKAGMLPPRTENPEHNDWLQIPKYMNEWEDEDAG